MSAGQYVVERNSTTLNGAPAVGALSGSQASLKQEIPVAPSLVNVIGVANAQYIYSISQGNSTDGSGVTWGQCDPNSGTPGDAIAVFYTMGPGDQPFTVGVDDDGVWTQLPDALGFTGDQGADNNLFGHMSLARTMGSVPPTVTNGAPATSSSSAGNRVITSCPVGVTTISSSMRAALQPSFEGQNVSRANTMPGLISCG